MYRYKSLTSAAGGTKSGAPSRTTSGSPVHSASQQEIGVKIPNQFMSLFKDDKARDLLCDYAEVVLDAITDDKTLEAIPIVNTLTKGGAAVLSFRDRIFVKKISTFLKEVEAIDPERRKEYLESLEEDGERERAGEQLLVLIDRLDSEEKAKLVGRLFRKRVEGNLSESWFSVIVNAIDKVYYKELHMLRAGVKNPNILKDQVGEIFVPYRIVDRKLRIAVLPDRMARAGSGEASAEVSYELTKIGKVLLNVLTEEYGELG